MRVTGIRVPSAQVRASVLSRARRLQSLVCHAKAVVERYDHGYKNNTSGGACFDRASYPTCYEKQWTRGEPYTVLSLTGPSSCGVARALTPAEYGGPRGTMPNHAIFFMQHIATGEQTCSSVYSSLPDDDDPFHPHRATVVSRLRVNATSYLPRQANDTLNDTFTQFNKPPTHPPPRSSPSAGLISRAASHVSAATTSITAVTASFLQLPTAESHRLFDRAPTTTATTPTTQSAGGHGLLGAAVALFGSVLVGCLMTGGVLTVAAAGVFIGHVIRRRHSYEPIYV